MAHRTRLVQNPLHVHCSCNTHQVSFSFHSPFLSFINSAFFRRVRPVDHWVPRRIEQIRHGVQSFWTTPNESTRELIEDADLETHPLTDDNNHEIPIYTENGRQVARRVAMIDANEPPLAGLLKLRNVGELFDNDVQPDGYNDDWAEMRDNLINTHFRVFPQAGLMSYGHIQANGLISRFLPFLWDINRQVSITNERAGSLFSDDGQDDEGPRSPHPAVTGIAMQAYNSVMHYARGRGATHHDAQLGLVTAALAGSYAHTSKERNVATAKGMLCRDDRPHDRFARKIEEDGVSRELRFENVYCLDLKAMKQEAQDGG
jgi:hypothetical protein